MNVDNHKRTCIGLLITITLASVVAFTVAAQGDPPKLEGLWRVEQVVYSCQTGDPMGPPSYSFYAFARGGTVTEVNSGGGPVRRGTSLGVWRHTGGHSFSASSYTFLTQPDGSFLGIGELVQTIDVGTTGNEFSARGTVVFYDVNGDPLPGLPPFPVCPRTTGRRVE